ncbi:MAG: flavin reductase, partial [Streptococcaceae bacterium]|nr:flavin reductase [Streptococcaceae bacterium]
MPQYKTQELPPPLVYKLLSGSVIPRPIAWVTTQNAQGVVNAAPFSFFNVVSAYPPIVSISMLNEKDTLNNLLANKEAVI